MMPAFLGQTDRALCWRSADVTRTARPTEQIERLYRNAISEVPRLDGEEVPAAKEECLSQCTKSGLRGGNPLLGIADSERFQRGYSALTK